MVLLPSNCLQLCFDTFTTTIFLYGHCNVIYKCPLRYFNTGKKSKKQQISDETQGRLARTEKPLNNFSTPFHGNGWMDCQPLILIVHPLIATKRNMLCDKIEIYKFRFTKMAGSSLPTFDTIRCPFHSQNNVGLLDSWHSACNLQPMQSEKAETNFGAPLRLKEEKPHTFITKVIGLCTSNIFA